MTVIDDATCRFQLSFSSAFSVSHAPASTPSTVAGSELYPLTPPYPTHPPPLPPPPSPQSLTPHPISQSHRHHLIFSQQVVFAGYSKYNSSCHTQDKKMWIVPQLECDTGGGGGCPRSNGEEVLKKRKEKRKGERTRKEYRKDHPAPPTIRSLLNSHCSFEQHRGAPPPNVHATPLVVGGQFHTIVVPHLWKQLRREIKPKRILIKLFQVFFLQVIFESHMGTWSG